MMIIIINHSLGTYWERDKKEDSVVTVVDGQIRSGPIRENLPPQALCLGQQQQQELLVFLEKLCIFPEKANPQKQESTNRN